MITLTIVAVMLSMAIPALLASTPKDRLRDAAMLLAQDVKFARSIAVSGSIPVGVSGFDSVDFVEVSFDDPTDAYVVTAVNVDAGGVETRYEIRRVSTANLGAIRLDLTATATPIRFESNGTADQRVVATLRETTTNLQRTISIARAGLVRVD
jgi:Tfp pilus assembly protein FimT